MTTLDQATIGETYRVHSITGASAVKRRIMDMGVTRKAEVKVLRTAPMGDPIDVLVRGYQLSIRKEDARHVQLESV